MFHVGDILAEGLAINRGEANESYACELWRKIYLLDFESSFDLSSIGI